MPEAPSACCSRLRARDSRDMTARIALSLMALALASPLTAVAQAGGNIRAEIEKQDKAWEKAYNSGDAAAVTALYAKDAVVMDSIVVALSGLEPGLRNPVISSFVITDSRQWLSEVPAPPEASTGTTLSV